MADKKISELTSASALAGTEVLPIVQSGETKKLALNAITTLGTIATGTWQGTQIANAYIATLTTAGKVANSATTATDANTVSAIVARDASGNFSAGTITATLTGNAATATKLSSSRTFALTGDVTGSVSSDLTTGISITAAIASGVIVNDDINASAAIVDTKLATISTAGKVLNSATTASSANTLNAIVSRDASGNFVASTVFATLSGNASTATALQTARNINGVSFNGTADITVTAAAGTLTGATLASGVTASSLTSVGTLTSLVVSGTTTLGGVAYTWPASAGTNSYVLSTNGSGTLSWVAQSGGGGGATLTIGSYLTGGSYNGSSAVTIAADATSTNTASKLVARDASGNFAAGAVTASSIVVSGTTSLNSVAYTWPATSGTNGQVLGTNGAGTLSWINAGGGGGGGTTTFPLTAGTYLTGGTFDGSTAVTFAVDGTSANTASKVVARDANGDFAASIVTGTGFQLNTTTAATAAVGRFRWDANTGTADILLLGGNVDLAIGESSVARVLNNTGSPLTLGQVVYITGASGQRPTVALANAISEATSTSVIGFVAESIANNQEGFVRTFGVIEGLNTFAFNEGDLLYLSDTTPGAFTNVRPTQPSHGVRLGYVIKKNLVDGHIYIAVNNGYELEELHDVLITAPAAYNMLRRNAANTLWVNVAGPSGDVVGTTDSQTLTNKTISGASNTLSNIPNGATTATNASTASAIVARDANGSSSFKNVKLDGTTSGTVTVQPAAAAGTWSLTLPTSGGTNGQVLTTDGTGIATWATATGSVTLAATTTNATFYPLIYNATTGTTSTLNVDTGWTFNPSTNAMQTPGTLTLGGVLTMQGNSLAMGTGQIQNGTLLKISETYLTPSISAGALTLDVGAAHVHRVSRNQNITTITISNVPSSGAAFSFTLIFDANGTSYTTTWPAAVKWPGGTAPTITTTNGRSDMFVFYTNNAGTTWYAMTAAQNFVTT